MEPILTALPGLNFPPQSLANQIISDERIRGRTMRFLLLNGAEDSYWGIFLAEVVAPLGILSIAPAVHGMPVGDDELDGLIVIDATNVEQVEKLVAGLRTENPARRIVVMTASPTWQRARAAFEAGAIDYLPKTLPADELRALFEDILRRPLPPWPV